MKNILLIIASLFSVFSASVANDDFYDEFGNPVGGAAVGAVSSGNDFSSAAYDPCYFDGYCSPAISPTPEIAYEPVSLDPGEYISEDGLGVNVMYDVGSPSANPIESIKLGCISDASTLAALTAPAVVEKHPDYEHDHHHSGGGPVGTGQ